MLTTTGVTSISSASYIRADIEYVTRALNPQLDFEGYRWSNAAERNLMRGIYLLTELGFNNLKLQTQSIGLPGDLNETRMKISIPDETARMILKFCFEFEVIDFKITRKLTMGSFKSDVFEREIFITFDGIDKPFNFVNHSNQPLHSFKDNFKAWILEKDK